MLLELKINGEDHKIDTDPRSSLLELLRDDLDLVGTKRGCNHGQCGACTVLEDGTRILACLKLAATVRGEITTIEGICGQDSSLHPMQQAFLDFDSYQCGYCTPGQIMSAIGWVNEGAATDRDSVKEAMSGNLCRCAAYPNIVDAILVAVDKMEFKR